MSGLVEALGGKVVVCVGSGGVGKTTTSAALALHAAAQGRKVLVATIDPAKRLANSMGLTELTNAELRVPDEALQSSGLTIKGELYAMMLDLKRSWDEVITRYAPSPAARDAILANRFYKQMSTALAGSHEYVAMEKLHALHQKGTYDLIVLDTPPTSQALDFLDAPNRVIDFLDNETARWLMAPAASAGLAGLKVLQVGSGYMTKILSRFTGAGTLEELARFMGALSGMYEGFKQRAAEVKKLLSSPSASFVLVTSPSPMVIDEALRFHGMLRDARMQVAAIVANRVTPDLSAGAALDRARIVEAGNALEVPGIPGLPSLGERLWTTVQDERSLAEADRGQLQRLVSGCGATPVVAVPRFDHDVHDLAGLAGIAAKLVGTS